MLTEADAGTLNKITTRPASYRWMQLFMGIVCMAMIAKLQYGWTLFVNPIAEKFGWTRAAIQVAFTIFVLTETWLVPIEGYLVDRFGPRPVVMVGGLLCGIGWVLNSFADSLALLYFAAAVSGIGAGADAAHSRSEVQQRQRVRKRVQDPADPAQQTADHHDGPRAEAIDQIAFDGNQP